MTTPTYIPRFHRPRRPSQGGASRGRAGGGHNIINEKRDVLLELRAVEATLLEAHGASISDVGARAAEIITDSLAGELHIHPRRRAASRVRVFATGDSVTIAVNADDVPADWVVRRDVAAAQRMRRPIIHIRAHRRRRGPLRLSHRRTARRHRLPGYPFVRGRPGQGANEDVEVREHRRRAVSGPVVYDIGQQGPERQRHTFWSPKSRALRRRTSPGFFTQTSPTRVFVRIQDAVQRILMQDADQILTNEYPQALMARLRGTGRQRLHGERLHDVRLHSGNPYIVSDRG